MELTIIIPALNEEETIEIVIKKAQEWIKQNKIQAEVLVVDNNSTDKTAQISESLGARVVKQEKSGYGITLRKGIEEAQGKYVIMGDADDSYDFLELDAFITKLREGYDFVIGNRYGYKMEKNAMPFLHKYIGTPMLSYLIRKRFGSTLKDINCGLRGGSRESLLNLKYETTGMEFASEMIIKAYKANLKITEVPIHFYQDKRKRKPHLKTFQDGMRHLKLICKEAKIA